MVGMRMIPTDHFQALLARRFFGLENIFRGHRKTVARGIVSPIDERKKLQDFPRGGGRAFPPIDFGEGGRIASQQRTAAFMRIRLRAMRADFLREMPADPEFCRVRHNYSSSQNRSFKYFDAESANTVTITASAFFGLLAA